MTRWLTIIITGVTMSALWSSSLLLPFKLLVVLVHEMWHGIAALLSGAYLAQIHIDMYESGETIVSQLNSESGFVLTVSAGYLGSAATGAFLLNRGLAKRLERTSLALFALSLGYMSYIFTMAGSTAFLVGIGWALFIGAISFFVPAFISSAILLFLGTLFTWYCFYDLLDFTYNVSATDAGILAKYMVEKEWLAADTDVVSLTGWIAALWSLAALAIVSILFYSGLGLRSYKIGSKGKAIPTETAPIETAPAGKQGAPPETEPGLTTVSHALPPS